MEFTFPILDYYGGPILFALFVLLLILESYFTLRVRTENRKTRIFRNSVMAVIGLFFLRLAVIPAMVFAAKWAAGAEIGLFNWISVPGALEFVFTFLILNICVASPESPDSLSLAFS